MASHILPLLPAAVVVGAAALGLCAAQLAAPLNCTWPSLKSGTLKRRIAQLRAATPGRSQRMLVSGVLILAIGGAALAAHGMGLRPSPVETSIVADLKLDYRQVDAQVASLKIPPRPPEPLNTDPVVWAKRATDAQFWAQKLRSEIPLLGANTGAARSLGIRNLPILESYMGRSAQYQQAEAAAARSATVGALALTHAISNREKSSARQQIQAAQDAYRAAKDKDFAIRLAQNHYVGDSTVMMHMAVAAQNRPLPDGLNYPLLRQKAQALLSGVRTHGAAQALIKAIDDAQVAADKATASSVRSSDELLIGYEYETYDRSILERAQDAQVPARIASDIAGMQAWITRDQRLQAQLALARLDPSFPVPPKLNLPAKLPSGMGPASLTPNFSRERALTIRYEQQYRGFILGRPNPDMKLVALYNDGIRRLRALPDPNPAQIDPMRQPKTDQEKANWNRPMPNGSPYGVDPGIAFLEQQIQNRSYSRPPDLAVIARMQAHLNQLKAGKEPV